MQYGFVIITIITIVLIVQFLYIVQEDANMDYDMFLDKEEVLQEYIKAIHKNMNKLEATLVSLDAEADKAIEELHQLQLNYYGDESDA